MLKTLKKTMVSWQAFPSLLPRAPKTPFPFPFKRLPRRLGNDAPGPQAGQQARQLTAEE